MSDLPLKDQPPTACWVAWCPKCRTISAGHAREDAASRNGCLDAHAKMTWRVELPWRGR
jgi:hypothetical protein